jgi:glucokinase
MACSSHFAVRFRAAFVSKSKMKTHFTNLPLRFATALCLLLLSAAQAAQIFFCKSG